MNTHFQTPSRHTAAARRQAAFDNDPRYAYLEFLRFEARLLQIELFPESDQEREFHPVGTFAAAFHRSAWADPQAVPRPSSRAIAVLEAAGVKIPARVRRAVR